MMSWVSTCEFSDTITFPFLSEGCTLRMGGRTPCDSLNRYAFGGHRCSKEAIAGHTCLTEDRWHEILGFAKKTGLRIVFGLNLMFGRGADGTGEWDSTNAESLLKSTAAFFPHERPQYLRWRT